MAALARTASAISSSDPSCPSLVVRITTGASTSGGLVGINGAMAARTLATNRVRASAWAVIPRRSATDSTVASQMAAKASSTPCPVVATVSNTGYPLGLSRRSSSARDKILGKSRLLY
ncbi:hypothetical protein HRbin09_00881 [bacterium HR09]|nr:hypothetical protein HRbin09_00881 [bacterium HR09]